VVLAFHPCPPSFTGNPNSLNPPPPLTPAQQQERAAYQQEEAARQQKEAAQEAADQAREAVQKADQQKEKAAFESCRADWRKCRDNKAIVYTYAGGADGISPRVACEFAANELAKYGTPEWPGFPAYSFNNFYSSTSKSALVTGHLILIENEARFQNAFGAMAHVRVTCDYNLNDKTTIVHVEQP
jgi:hypothetical protein